MVQPFGYEKLIVYQKGMRFATLRGAMRTVRADEVGGLSVFCFHTYAYT